MRNSDLYGLHIVKGMPHACKMNAYKERQIDIFNSLLSLSLSLALASKLPKN